MIDGVQNDDDSYNDGDDDSDNDYDHDGECDVECHKVLISDSK